MPRTGPLVIAYDASSASKLAIDEAGNLFPGQPALVVHVWEAGAAYEAVADPTLRVTQELDARAIVIGSHGHRALRELLLGSTTRSIIKDAACPVVVVRDQQKERATAPLRAEPTNSRSLRRSSGTRDSSPPVA